MPHIARILICLPQSIREAPSNATFRMASFSCFNGSISQKPCNHLGKACVEKNVPPNKNCGSVNIFANGGMELSFLATLLMIKPNPINTMRPRKLSTIISRKVASPFISCLLYTSDAADEEDSVDLGGR